MKKYLFVAMVASWFLIACQTGGDAEPEVSKPKIKAAKERALEKDERARIVWSAGRKKDGGAMTEATETETFGFVAVAYRPTGSHHESWELTCEEDRWEISSCEEPMGIRLDIDLPDVAMDVCDALRSARQAGYTEPFHNWELLQGLHPDIESPFYAFQIKTGFVIVDTVTGEVKFEGN